VPAEAQPDLVDVAGLVPDAVLDLRYATRENFMGRPLYPEARCLLLRPAAERLARAAARLRRQGYRLVLWDCYRPLSAQREMWRANPRAGYVADPARGSHHNRGAAVDLSLAAADGRRVEMPTPFDAFGPRAHADATEGITEAARRHRHLLRAALEAEGFLVNPREWWHFAARDAWSHPLLDVPLSEGGR
jgi:D-alanyl-D-alanine dipeptidase